MYNSISILIFFKPSIKGKYVVPKTNNSIDETYSAYITGIPCKVVSEVYTKKVYDVDENVIDVESLLTGYQYTVYADQWIDIYDTKEAAIANSKLDPELIGLSILAMKYYPRDNSYIQDRHGKHASLIGKETTVFSPPYVDVTEFGKKKVFIDVLYDGKIYRTLFMEWCFYKDDRDLCFHDYFPGW